MKKTLLLPFVFTSIIACDGSDGLLSYEPEAGANFGALRRTATRKQYSSTKTSIWMTPLLPMKRKTSMQMS